MKHAYGKNGYREPRYCSIEGCVNRARVKGMCLSHYNKKRKEMKKLK